MNRCIKNCYKQRTNCFEFFSSFFFSLHPFPSRKRNPEEFEKWCLKTTKGNYINLGYESDKKLCKLQPPKQRRIDYRIDLTENGNHENEPTTTLGKNTGEPEEPKTQYVSTQIENPSGNEMKLLKEVALLKETIRRKNQRISKLRNYVLQLKSQAKENIMSIVKKSAKIKFYTGLPNVESFEGLHELASPMIRKSGMAK